MQFAVKMEANLATNPDGWFAQLGQIINFAGKLFGLASGMTALETVEQIYWINIGRCCAGCNQNQGETQLYWLLSDTETTN